LNLYNNGLVQELDRSEATTMTSQTETADSQVFVPSFGRYLLTELWSSILTLGVIAAFLYYRGTLEWPWLTTAGIGSLLLLLLGAAFSRQSRRLAIGDTWISGPTGGGSESATITFSTLDLAISGFRKGRLRVQALGGQRITTRMAWYSDETVEEIQRLVRDRCGIMPPQDR
jgi:hypothetical protein